MSGEYVLETEGLTKEFAGFTAVKDVQLRVKRGSIHALIGPNGAGKTIDTFGWAASRFKLHASLLRASTIAAPRARTRGPGHT